MSNFIYDYAECRYAKCRYAECRGANLITLPYSEIPDMAKKLDRLSFILPQLKNVRAMTVVFHKQFTFVTSGP